MLLVISDKKHDEKSRGKTNFGLILNVPCACTIATTTETVVHHGHSKTLWLR